jgi:LPS-assembly lipoprotein
MPMRRSALPALASLVLLAGCGFQPMYAPAAQGGPAIGPIFVDTVPTKAGYVLKSELDRLFDVERGRGPVRRLSITLSESVAGLGFRLDESASRSDLILAASYTLYDVNGKAVLNGAVNAVASYDIPSSAYGEIAAQNDARERAAEVLAERLRSELALKLARQRVASATLPSAAPK